MRLIIKLLAVAVIAVQLTACFPAVVGGVAAGGAMAADRRTSGTYIEDEAIELKAKKSLMQELNENVHANVTSFNRNVLISGEAFSEKAKARAEEIVKNIDNVRSVTNELVVAPNTTLANRSNDAFITSKVKASMLKQNRFPPNYVKVVTENRVVFLMGMVTQQEAAAAAEIASSISGVEKVVKVFEYLD